MHDYHEVLPGYDPARLLQDGCAECEARGADPLEAIVRLDPVQLRRAWARAAAWQRDRLPGREPVSKAEAPMLRTLWAVQLAFERAGTAPLGVLPKSISLMEALMAELALDPVRHLQRVAADADSDLNTRLTPLEREAILTACDRALKMARTAQ